MTKIIVATKQALINVTREADDIVKELSGLKMVCESVQHICEKARGDYGSQALPPSDATRLKELCGRLALSVEDCKGYMNQLESLFNVIFGTSNRVWTRKSIMKIAVKQLLKKDELQEIQRKISKHRSNIQGDITCLSSFYQFELLEYSRQSLKTINSMSTTIDAIQTLMRSFHCTVNQYLQPNVQSQFQPSLFSVRSIHLVDPDTKHDHRDESLGNFHFADSFQSRQSLPRKRIHASYKDSDRNHTLVSVHNGGRTITNNGLKVEEIASRSESGSSINEIFNVPHFSIDGFVGREHLVTEITSHLIPSSQTYRSFDKPIIFSGLGGMGKTHLALKVAYTLRDSYFAIFWIDASSDQLARASWADIAIALGLEPNLQRTYDYLLTLKCPWLVIVDGLDNTHLKHFIPSGNFGRIVITTRLPLHELVYAGITVQKHYHLERLSNEESVQLLVTKMVRIEPLSNSDMESFTELIEMLQYIPLALVQAASYMRSRSIGPVEYAKLYRATSFVDMETASMESSLSRTVRIAIERLTDDALQILKLISFFYGDNIPIKILFVGHPNHSEKARNNGEVADDENSASPFPQTSFPIIRHVYSIACQLSDISTFKRLCQRPSVLPRILRPSIDSRASKARVYAALTSLAQYALIRLNRERTIISIHRLIADFVVTTFDNLAEKATTCEAALTTLTDCVELENQTFGNVVLHIDSRNLLPHIMNVEQWSQEICQQYQAKQQSIGQMRFILPRFWWQDSTSAKSDPLRLMKLSVVYFTNGEYQSARIMREQALSLLLQHGGTMLNPQCVHTSSALALTYHRLHLFDKAIEQQRQSVEASEKLYGKESNITLGMVDILGLYYLSRGDLNESLQYSQQARLGLEKLPQNIPKNKTALTALNHLGAVQAQYYRWEKSRELCKMALDGLQRSDPEGSEIWLAKQNIAIATIRLNDSDYFAEAEELITDVWNHWNDSLGEKHPTTLLTVFNRCRILFCRNMISEAENLLRPALKVAETRLGAKHFSFLSAHLLLACIKLRQRDYTQAEVILIEVNDSYAELEYASNHVDRIATLWYLMECYKEQYRFDEALEIWEEMYDSLKISMNSNLRTKHPLAKNLHIKRQELETLKHSAKIAMMRMLESNANVDSQVSQIEGAVPQAVP